MASQIDSYILTSYGSATGQNSIRAQIELLYAGNSVGRIRFKDPSMTGDNDVDNGSIILMHLPLEMYHSTLDTLRNEKPMHIYFAGGSGVLSTSAEPLGEAE